MFDKLEMAVSLGLLHNLDLYFAREMFRLDASSNELLMLPAALAAALSVMAMSVSISRQWLERS